MLPQAGYPLGVAFGCGTEHVLLGILETSNGAAAEVLHRMGLPVERVWAEVMRVLAQRQHKAQRLRPCALRPATCANIYTPQPQRETL